MLPKKGDERLFYRFFDNQIRFKIKLRKWGKQNSIYP